MRTGGRLCNELGGLLPKGKVFYSTVMDGGLNPSPNLFSQLYLENRPDVWLMCRPLH